MAPAGTPPAVIARLNAKINKVLEKPTLPSKIKLLQPAPVRLEDWVGPDDDSAKLLA
jgi:tripartite-type tricarboxylate transporter receptor subunit TctC